ncbi:MAG: AAA family ATPase [Bacteroidia bacterium]|nr:AAA family ATPase [Bacteroidia bacterium]
MELLYLYIKGHIGNVDAKYKSMENNAYKVLKNAEFNFSNEYIISFNESEARLTLEENKEYIPGFFDESQKIKNISAIVGRNGTGKSSVLDFIKALYKTMYKNNPYKFIAVFESTEDSLNQFYIVYNEVQFKAESIPTNFRKNFNDDNKQLASTFSISSANIPDYELIFYSNLFEIKFSSTQSLLQRVDTTGFEDISTYNLLMTDPVHKSNTEKIKNIADISKIHKLMDVERQIRLKTRIDIPENLLDFKIPKYLEISIDDYDEREFIETTGDSYKMLQRGFDDSQKGVNGKKEIFLAKLYRAAYFNVFRYLADNTPPGLKFDRISNEIFVNKNYTSEKVSNYILKLSQQNESGVLQSRFLALHDFLLGISALPDDSFVDLGFGNIYCYIDFESPEEQKNLLVYFVFFNLSGFLFFDWKFDKYSNSELSSGEKALFSMLARFNYLVQGPIKKEYKNVLILIDEGEQLLHPEWQRNYINILTTYFPLIFEKAESIQIIVTSHSPFLLSDLPRYCITYLDKIDGVTVAKSGSDKTFTFGGNIHELLTDSFFLGSSLIGEFARLKISNMLKDLKSSAEIDLEKKEKYTKLAKQIGEKFIKEKTLELINAKPVAK